MSNRIRIGGDLERSLNQGYRLDIKGILQEGWTQTRANGFGLLLAIAGVVAIWLLLTQTMVAPHLTEEDDPGLTLLLSLLITVLISPMTSALDMLGVQQSLGVRARAGQVFDFFRHFVRLGSLSLLSTLCTSLFGPLFAAVGLPVMLALVPSTLIGMGLLFSVPLMLERGVSPPQAILLSLRLFLRGLPTLLLLHGVMLLLFFLALIPMGLGLLWVAPLYYNVKGILYRDLCGIGVEVTEKPASPDHFNA
ncbi:hypothetical protein G114_15226 [Aeromonas diversa CDC 2478-85]|uniref:Uncharacterized protein n=1 Tax=Aeromonas diversa CDC 2478-85 TaxID=1268237 RepID=N9TY31_9GAMM|nr:hypothetical protein G114_15226 [Aeromonas diversa CDC 2478-85]